jgi:hypothetical protein
MMMILFLLPHLLLKKGEIWYYKYMVFGICWYWGYYQHISIGPVVSHIQNNKIK